MLSAQVQKMSCLVWQGTFEFGGTGGRRKWLWKSCNWWCTCWHEVAWQWQIPAYQTGAIVITEQVKLPADSVCSTCPTFPPQSCCLCFVFGICFPIWILSCYLHLLRTHITTHTHTQPHRQTHTQPHRQTQTQPHRHTHTHTQPNRRQGDFL